MNIRLAPILTRECDALSWKVNPKKSALENLQELLRKINSLAESLASRQLAPKDQIEGKARLRAALAETSQTIAGAALLWETLRGKWAQDKCKALEKKDEATLLRDLLRLSQNEPKLRAKSHTYEEAWPEVEARYFAKMSLYSAELAKRR